MADEPIHPTTQASTANKTISLHRMSLS